MAGVKSLRRIQLGQETTAGTAVASTALWRGQGVIEDQRELNFVEEDIGFFSGADRSYISKFVGALSMPDTPATFEQVGYILAAGVKDVTTGTADTGGSGKIYAYTFPTSALNSVQTFTVEGGDNQQEEEMYYSFVESFALTGAGGEALMLNANWLGRQVQNGTFTTQPATPTVEDILFSKGKLYIDAAGGTIGSTQVSSTLLSMSLSVDTGILPKWTADGSLDFNFHQFTRPEVTLELTYEHNASAVTEKTAWRNETARLIRLDFEGSTLTTAGSSHTVKVLRIDLAGKYESFAALSDQDGNDTVTATFRGLYNATASTFGEIKVVSEVSPLT
jgi:hypothetical protein